MAAKVTRSKYEQDLTSSLNLLLKNNLKERRKLARYVGICDRTVRNWLHEQTCPSGYDLILLMQYSNLTFDVVLELILGQEAAREVCIYMKENNIY